MRTKYPGYSRRPCNGPTLRSFTGAFEPPVGRVLTPNAITSWNDPCIRSFTHVLAPTHGLAPHAKEKTRSSVTATLFKLSRSPRLLSKSVGLHSTSCARKCSSNSVFVRHAAPFRANARATADVKGRKRISQTCRCGDGVIQDEAPGECSCRGAGVHAELTVEAGEEGAGVRRGGVCAGLAAGGDACAAPGGVCGAATPAIASQTSSAETSPSESSSAQISCQTEPGLIHRRSPALSGAAAGGTAASFSSNSASYGATTTSAGRVHGPEEGFIHC